MIARRLLLAVLAAPLLKGDDPAQEVWDLLAEMAAALVDGDAGRFVLAFDPKMPGFQELRAAVSGLLARAEVESTIDPVQNTGDDRRRTLEADWSMRLVDREGARHITERRAAIKCGFEKQGKKWKVVSFAPADFFAPPSAHVDFAHQR
jgi:hypothetical protein